MNNIRDIEIINDKNGNPVQVKIVFGPHYYIDIQPDEQGVLSIYAGATHNGFKAHATEVMDEWEQIIEQVRKLHPDKTTD
jgi:hypothetical protein